MEVLSLVLIFVLGAIVGSFVNVVSLRYNTGLSPLRGRSLCPHCGRELSWYDLVPVVSFAILRGRCRSCSARLSWQYPIIELTTGLLFVGIALRQYYYWPLYSALPHGLLYSVLFFVFYAIVFSLLLVIFIYDLRHKIIPDPLVYAFIALSVGKLLLFFYGGMGSGPWWYLAAPFILATPFALLWFFSQGTWIGLGDAKLIFGIAALLGLSLGLSAVTIAFWVGAVWGIWMIYSSRMPEHREHALEGGERVNMKSEVPFAPFLIAATIFVFFSHVDVFGLSHIFNGL